MIKVNVTPDIVSFKEKIKFNLTWRQIICLGAAAAVFFLLYSKFNIPVYIRRFVVLILVTPIVLIGFVQYQGIYFEKFLFYIFLKYWNIQLRFYKPEFDIIDEIKGGHVVENTRKKHNRPGNKH